MKRIIFFTGCILSFCLLFTSCAELLNGVWADKDGSSSSSSSSGGSTTTTTTTTTTSTTYGVFANTTWKKSFTDETDVITFNSNGTYEWNQDDLTSADVDFTYKGTYTVSGNEVTLTSLTYAKCKLGAAWTGSCAVKRYMYLLDGVLYLDVTKRTGSGTSIVGSWTQQIFRVHYDSDSSYVICGISTLTTTRTFTVSGTVSDTNVEKYTYNNTADGTDNTTYDSGTYTTSGTTATVVFKSDNLTAVYYRDGNDLCYAGSGAASTTLSTPSGLTAGSTTSTSVSLSWNAVTGATGYKVYYGTSSTASSMSLAGSTTDLSYVVTGLTADTKYYFCVSAYNTVTESSYSSFTYATTTNSAASVPEGLSASDITATSVTLCWNKVPKALQYRVNLYFYSSSSSQWLLQVNPEYYTTTTTYQFTNLSANSPYRFSVVAINNNEESAISPYIEIRTSYYVTLAAVTNLQVTSTTYNTVSLSWSAVTNATYYRVYYNTSNDFSTSTICTFGIQLVASIPEHPSSSSGVIDTVTTTSATVGGTAKKMVTLSSETTYYFWVVAYGDNSTKGLDGSAVSGKTKTFSSSSSIALNPAIDIVSLYGIYKLATVTMA